MPAIATIALLRRALALLREECQDLYARLSGLVAIRTISAGGAEIQRLPGGGVPNPRRGCGVAGRRRRARAERALDELFTQVLAWGGAITGEHGVGLAKRRWWPQALSAENRALHRRLKDALDPRAILNPGKFLDETTRD